MKKDNHTVTMKHVVKLVKKAYRDNGKSWTKTAKKMGVSRGTLIRIAGGYEPKAPEIRRALGLTVFSVIEVCKKCGQAHVSKRCAKRNTFEDNCREYDTWLSNPKTQQQLSAMLQWAETSKEQRQWNR